MKRGFIGGLIIGGALTMVAKTLLGNKSTAETSTRFVRRSRSMMRNLEMDDLVQGGAKVARKTGRRILRSMSR
jgi:gas vesicle protein